MSDIFGYFDHPNQIDPSRDPGLDVLCPFCLIALRAPYRTTSLMIPGDSRSFFYRAHKSCADSASPTEVGEIEGALIDSRVTP